MSTHKLDIFDVLGAIDRHDYGFLERQPEENRKGFAPPVVLRWASSVRGEARDLMLLLVNERANLDFYALGDHPDLQYRLLAACGLGMRPKHEWIAMPARAKPKSAIHAFIGGWFPEANADEIDLLLGQFTRESFHEFVNDCGLNDKDARTAIDAYDRYTGHVPKKKARAKR